MTGHVVEVDDVTDRVEKREEARGAGDDLVELDVSVERNVLLDGELLELGEEVTRHGDQQQAVAEGEGSSGPTSHSDTHPHDVPQVCVLCQERVVWKNHYEEIIKILNKNNNKYSKVDVQNGLNRYLRCF